MERGAARRGGIQEEGKGGHQIATAGPSPADPTTFLIGDEVRAGRLVPVPLDVPALELPGVFAVYPGTRRPPAKVRAFVDYLAGRFGPMPPWDRGLGFEGDPASPAEAAIGLGRSGAGQR